MKRYFVTWGVWVIVMLAGGSVLLGAAPPVREADTPLKFVGAGLEQSSLLQDGPLTRDSAKLRDFLSLDLNGGRLALDHNRWRTNNQNADNGPLMGQQPPAKFAAQIRAFRQYHQAIGSSGTGSSYSGEYYDTGFDAQKYSGRLRLRTTSFGVTVTEQPPAGRFIDVYEENTLLRLFLSHPDGDFLVINQGSNGSISVVLIVSGRVTAVAADSLAALLKEHYELVAHQVPLILDTLGIGLNTPISADNQSLAAAVLGNLTPQTPDARQRYDNLVKQLGDDNFQVREQATAELKAQFTIFAGMIAGSLQAPGLNAEAAARLKSISEDNTDLPKAQKLAQALQLDQNPDYLIELLAKGKPSPPQRQIIVSQLQKITGQKIGDDPAAWHKALHQ